MKYILLIIVFSCFALHSFTQKDEKLRFLIKDSEKTDSAYLKTIIQKIYFSAFEGRIKAYFNARLNHVDASFKSINEFCELVIVQGESRSAYDYDEDRDSLICTKIILDSIKTFSIYKEEKSNLPKSISIEFKANINDENMHQNLWISFSDLSKILTQKQISAILESTKYLPQIENYPE